MRTCGIRNVAKSAVRSATRSTTSIATIMMIMGITIIDVGSDPGVARTDYRISLSL